jgi:UDP-N-acetylmuramoyl-L-alanyl-D-glutamate--2,6-diaminopimelate ligase
VAPVRLPIHLPLLGSQQLGNAALAATAALAVGASAESVAQGLASAPPIRRRMQIVRERAPMIVDDTVGNPRSMRAVFETVRLLPPAPLRVVYALRGMRGPVINANNVRALLAELPNDALLVVTESDEAAGPRDRVRAEEREAAGAVLRESGRAMHYEPRLEDAIRRVLDGAGEGDLVLLLGAQGMDKGAELATARLGVEQ